MNYKSRVILFISSLLVMILNEVFLKSGLVYILITLIAMLFMVYSDFIRPILVRKKAVDISLEAKEGDRFKREILSIINFTCIAMLTIRKDKLTFLDFWLLGLIITTITVIIINYYYNNTVLISKYGVILSNGIMIKWQDINEIEVCKNDYRIKYRLITKNHKNSFSIILKDKDDILNLINICNEHYLDI